MSGNQVNLHIKTITIPISDIAILPWPLSISTRNQIRNPHSRTTIKLSNISSQFMLTSLCIYIFWKNSTYLRATARISRVYWCHFSRGRLHPGLGKTHRIIWTAANPFFNFSEVTLAYSSYRNPYEGSVKISSLIKFQLSALQLHSS